MADHPDDQLSEDELRQILAKLNHDVASGIRECEGPIRVSDVLEFLAPNQTHQYELQLPEQKTPVRALIAALEITSKRRRVGWFAG